MEKKKLLILTSMLLAGICIGVYCNLDGLFFAAYGISDVKNLDNKEIIKCAAKFNIPDGELYGLDTAYSSFLISLEKKDTAYKWIVKNHYQPLQAMYFDRNGKMFSFFINCYAGSFPNLKWNPNSEFDVFSPVQQADHTPDNLFNFFEINHFLKKLSEKENVSEQQNDCYVVVFWAASFGRQSKLLIDTVQKNRKLATGNVKYFFVNIDNCFYYEFEKKFAKRGKASNK